MKELAVEMVDGSQNVYKSTKAVPSASYFPIHQTLSCLFYPVYIVLWPS